MHWLKRQLLMWRIRRALEGKPFNKHQPDRTRIVGMLNLLQQEQFAHYNPSAGMAVRVNLLYRSVEELIELLQTIDSELQTKSFAHPPQASYGKTSIALEEYMVTKNGYIYDVRQAVGAFKHYALSICSILDSQRQGEREAFYEHNTRVLTHVLGDIDELVRGLLQIAYAKGE